MFTLACLFVMVRNDENICCVTINATSRGTCSDGSWVHKMAGLWNSETGVSKRSMTDIYV